MRNNPIIVQKYGGACLETPAKIRAVASSLADLHSRGHRVVAIVSAMGKTTDELVKMAYQVSPHPNRRELDMLLTTGERISMSLMSMALSDLGVPAISFTGSQAGVMTDESHSSARILDVRPIRVREELDRGRIVVLAGFQGVNPVTKEITTLGRGGSDTTAVAMAAVLKAECCEIIKEVDGVCSADPRIVESKQASTQRAVGTNHTHRSDVSSGSFCENDFSMIRRKPRCRQSVAQNGLILESLKGGLWTQRSIRAGDVRCGCLILPSQIAADQISSFSQYTHHLYDRVGPPTLTFC